MRRLLAAMILLAPLASEAAPLTKQPGFDCAKATQPAEKAICADDSLAAMDRLLGRVYRLAVEGQPADRVTALKAAQGRWLLDRNKAFKDANNDPMMLNGVYHRRIQEVIRLAGQRALAAAIAVAKPIDPLKEAGRDAEDDAGFVAYTLTTLFPSPDAPDPGGAEEVLSNLELYGGFSFAAALPDGRLFVAVPEGCGAYQCSNFPFLIDKAKGIAARLGVEVLADGKRRVDPGAAPVGLVSLNGPLVEFFEQGRGLGDCGSKWRYRVEGQTLKLVQLEEKPECDGRPWDGKGTKTRTF
ncbi:DUF1176 domain-containing protein [Azospirillum thermophilum]|uniref:Lysozyme inhibitor LprI-like N-terminal domain-containing protein n=1 Tax=Azospirillum thermophilum TaxID=2202148 RepID=A0A2S2CWP5_9PROT|nr:DUF1176 domain-containing protein [Azospirillum thermophilum]AWK88820.1 hypothetical protein DEW08_22375 [Azospirillum thermophilum]